MGQLSQECPLKMVFLVVAQDGVLGSGGSRVGMWVRLWANTSYGHSCLRVNEIGTKVACMAMISVALYKADQLTEGLATRRIHVVQSHMF